MTDPNAWMDHRRPRAIGDVEWNARKAAVATVREFGDWKWFVSLTFREDVREEHAKRALRWFLGHLAREVFGCHFKFARVMDRQPSGRWHFHVLIETPPGQPVPDPSLALDVWERRAPSNLCTGLSKPKCNDAKLFDWRQHHIAYMFLPHSGHEWNQACPRTGDCARRNGCAVAGIGWLP